MAAYEDDSAELHAVAAAHARRALAQVYLSRFQAGRSIDSRRADSDLRVGYSYARTTQEPTVRLWAEQLWQARLQEPAPATHGRGATEEPRREGRRGRRRLGVARTAKAGSIAT